MWIVHILITNLLIVFCVELFLAFLFGVRSGVKISTVILVNIITNPAVVMLSLCLTLFLRSFHDAGLFLAEITVVFIEGFMYNKFNTFTPKNPYLISLVLNVTSYIAGEFVNIIL